MFKCKYKDVILYQCFPDLHTDINQHCVDIYQNNKAM